MMLAVALWGAPADASGVVVRDGDTLELPTSSGLVPVRLCRIDAPERDQVCGEGRGWACGEAAAVRLRELVAGREVSCESRGTDRYGRVLAVCWAGGIDLGGALVAEGFAWAYRRYTLAYADVEDAARREGMGVWSGPAEPPWAWRARRGG